MIKFISALLFSVIATTSSATIIVEDEMGTFSIEQAPQKIVVLEYSFIDALATLGISPVGIADDGKTHSVISQISEKIKPWVSVGTRSTPNLEVIASLKPDMIIADFERHATIYEDLKKIAPTLVLKSRGETYADNLLSMVKVGQAVNQEEKIKQRLALHNQRMDAFAKEINSDKTFMFSVANAKGIWMHSPVAYAGGVISRLGLNSPIPEETQKAYISATLERLVKANPEYLLVGKYGEETIIDSFEKNPLWNAISSIKEKTYAETNPFLWSKNRGMIAAEIMAQELKTLIK